ncbi:restriction endonuclease [Alkalilimnicola sp. S0819]|uniref:restriction endonuclease n=1 Tax=Alkalilimnicola sp. S0819 TaxID=2613922 RepID=UPI001D001AD0|nr:restriction endonuclease [Alkalilimnicola sp. S0819]
MRNHPGPDIYANIKRLLDGGSLGLNPESCKLFQKKAYYSRDRDADIITDVSLELWMPGAERWSMLWVCECKDYSRPIAVDELEEFRAKLAQIGGVNVKGLFASTNSFQSSALNYARSQGFGLLRILPSDQVHFLMHCMTTAHSMGQERQRRNEYKVAMTRQGYTSDGRSFFGVYDGYVFEHWGQLMKRYIREYAEALHNKPLEPTR